MEERSIVRGADGPRNGNGIWTRLAFQTSVSSVSEARRSRTTATVAASLTAMRTRNQPYTAAFFEASENVGREAARVIVPIVLGLVQARSVVDVGCAEGAWLSVFRENGVDDLVGIDGSYIAPDRRLVSATQWVSRDLAEPIRLDRIFDLVVCLEVAEHLPATRAAAFVEDLTRLAPVVLFSAAIPFQGGVAHINEQWQDYWAEHFSAIGYSAVDAVRPLVWTHPQVKWFYAQNTLLYVRHDVLDRHPALSAARAATLLRPLRVVHPQKYLSVADVTAMPVRRVLRQLPGMLRHGLRRTLQAGRKKKN